jgi:hypothetical protein
MGCAPQQLRGNPRCTQELTGGRSVNRLDEVRDGPAGAFLRRIARLPNEI